MNRTALAAALVITLAVPALAHHSFAMYDMTQTKSATGKLIRFIPGANHAQLHFELIDNTGKTVMKDGKPSIMGVETGSAAQLARQGVTVDEFPLGTIITVAYHPLRDGRPKPVWEAVRSAWSPVAGTIEIWNRHFEPGQQLRIPVRLFNDLAEPVGVGAQLELVMKGNSRVLWGTRRRLDPFVKWDSTIVFTAPEKIGWVSASF